MASTVIAAILSLSDKMSPKLVKCGKAWDELNNKEKAAAKSAIATMDKIQKKATSMVSSILKLGSALAVSAVGLGFSEALGLEKYRTQLETATKDTKRAAEVMQYAVNLANKTPFEGGDMVAASAALETASLSTETYLTTLGDTAAAVNRSISDIQTQFIKAFSTGQTGEFFDSINVSRQSFEDFTKANKLSTASIGETQIALKRFLDEKFGGGMANLAKTTSGAWSTITGVTKSALAQMVGMGTDGTVRVGSALDKLREKAQYFSEKLVEWQENGQLDRYARDVGNALEMVWNIGEKVFTTLWGYREVVGVLATVGATVWAMQKAMAAYKTITEVARVATLLLNGTLTVSPVGVFVTALGLILSFGATYASTADDIVSANQKILKSNEDVADSAQKNVKELKNNINDDANADTNYVNKNKYLLTDKQDKKYQALVEESNKANGLIPRIISGGKPLAYYAGAVAWNGLNNIANWFFNFKAAGKLLGFDTLLGYANGTQYHTGGLALVGERGPELVDLPAGSRVMTAEKTRKLGGGTIVNNYITVTGAGRSDEEIADMVARRIIEETENAW